MAANPFDNPVFREEFKKEMADILKPVTDKQDAHAITLSEHTRKLSEHDGKFNKQTGGFIVLGFLGGIIETLFHWKWSK